MFQGISEASWLDDRSESTFLFVIAQIVLLFFSSILIKRSFRRPPFSTLFLDSTPQTHKQYVPEKV
jgi:hypothetical protein